MIQPAEALLHHMVAIAEEQLVAAKKMDAYALENATSRRQDLVFELELERGHIVPSEEITELQEKLENIDKRLMDVLQIVSDACQVLNPPKAPTTYTEKGRIKGYEV
jgi:hypothetical protein